MKIHCAYTQLVPVGDLKPHPKNPNRHPPEQIEMLSRILEHQGWRAPIVVSSLSGFIVAGHARREAALKLGFTEVPCDVQDFATEADELAHLLADNHIAELADEDGQMLKDLLKQLDDAGLDRTLAGILSEEDEAAAAPPPEYPMTPKLGETHDYVLVFVDNETDFLFLQTICGVQIEKSYKKTGVGVGRCVPFKRFLHALRQNRRSLDVAGENDHNPPDASGVPGVHPGEPGGGVRADAPSEQPAPAPRQRSRARAKAELDLPGNAGGAGVHGDGR